MSGQILLHGRLLNEEEAAVARSAIKDSFLESYNRGGFQQKDVAEVKRYRTLRELIKILDPHMDLKDLDPVIRPKWKRIHMVADSKDSHPTNFPPPGPFWQEPVEGEVDKVYIVAYLPIKEPLENWWPKASVKEVEHKEKIQYGVFPKPAWWHD